MPATLPHVTGPEGESAADRPPVDLVALRENLDTDDAFIRQVLHEFLHDTEMQLGGLQQAWLAGDIAQLQQAAHRLKGTAGNVFAIALQDGAAALDVACRNHDRAGMVLLLAKLQTDFASLKRHLESGVLS